MYNVATITINVDTETDHQFRETVKETLGEGKGKLGHAVKEAFELWIKRQHERAMREEHIALMKKGFDMGTVTFKRDELYD